MTPPAKTALRIALVYGVAAAVWILFSDRLLEPVFGRNTFGIPSEWWQAYNGLLFVALASGLLYALLARHVSSHFRTMGAYRESEDRWHRYLDRTPEPVLIIDRGRIIYLNDAAGTLLAATDRADVLGTEVRDFIDAPSDTERDAPARGAFDLNAGSPGEAEYSIRRLNGESRRVEARSASIAMDGRRCLLVAWVDITTRHEHERQLREAVNHAEEIVKLKSAILANLSHEVRTPLTAILGFSEILHDDPPEDPSEAIELIHRAGLRLKHTLESILTLADLESGNISLQPRLVDVRDVVRASSEVFRGEAHTKGLRLDVETAPIPVEAQADPSAVSRIVMNLVSNAIKFTDTGAVNVSVRQRDDSAEISVGDTGIGISDEFLPYVYDEFRQQSAGLTRMYEGAGLGLTIVRELVALQNGHIEVETRGGVGTVFRVRLPAALEPEPG